MGIGGEKPEGRRAGRRGRDSLRGRHGKGRDLKLKHGILPKSGNIVAL